MLNLLDPLRLEADQLRRLPMVLLQQQARRLPSMSVLFYRQSPRMCRYRAFRRGIRVDTRMVNPQGLFSMEADRVWQLLMVLLLV
jgi:hypothetical protein